MATKDVKRKLRAILSADVQGYSRLMGDDEVATVKTITEYRETLTSLVNQYNGRVVDSPGDNVLAEFGSVVDAVQCAVEIQSILKAKNEDLPENRRMIFRIGVNLGDIIQEGDRIYGDGVNIAARIESLADGGGICVSGTAYDHIKNKLALGYNFIGEHAVKNISDPVRVYKVPMEPGDVGKRGKGKRLKKVALAAAIVLILGTAAFAVWNFYLRPPQIEPASVEKMAFPLPEKPSIAVLPFTNMSGDPKQEYLSDGITESIITTVSRIPNLFVIARNSTFTYKGKAVKVQQVAEDLGVQYVLEGSVQRSGDRLRITAQLIDALSGHHVWSERYDRDLKDLFAMQDDITMEVLQAMRVKLTQGEQVLRANRPGNIEAALKCYKAWDYCLRFSPEANAMAKKLGEEVVAMEPNWGEGYYVLASAHMMDVWLSTTKSPKESIGRAIELSEKAVSLDDSLAQALGLLGYLYGMKREYDKSVAYAEKAVAKDPNGADAHAWLGNCLNFAARPEEAIFYYKKAIRLNPRPPQWYYIQLGQSYRMLGRYEESVAQLKKSLALSPNSTSAYAHLIFTYAEMGREDEARAAAAELLRINPKFSAEKYAKALPYKDRDYCRRWGEALRKAGLPETPSLPLPDKPSIAVLAFTNMSGDPEQELFSEGLAQNIITQLAKIPEMLVIARTSSFRYKGKSVTVQQVGRELGVRYVLEGSVQRSKTLLRVTAQLVDAKTGVHLWAQEYDRELQDFFQVQDEITLKVVTALQVKLTEGGKDYVLKNRTNNLKAWAAYMNCFKYWEKFTKEDNERAKEFAEQAIALDPNYSSAFAGMAWVYLLEYRRGWSKDPDRSLRLAEEFAKKSIAKDETNPIGHAGLSQIYAHQKKIDQAISKAERALELAPNDPNVVQYYARTRHWLGKPEEGLNMVKKAIRIRPFPPPHFTATLVQGYYLTEQYEKALAAATATLKQYPRSFELNIWLVLTYVALGQEKEARQEAKKLLENHPQFSAKAWAKRYFSCHKDPKIKARIIEQLTKAELK